MYITLIAVVIAAPMYFYPIFLMKVMCFALFAMAFNLLMGYGGLLSLGHAAFFGTGAYVSAYLSSRYGANPEISILIGTLAATAMGVVFGALAVRRHGIYLAMVTLGLSQLVYFFALRSPFTGAEDGIQGVKRGSLFGVISLRDDMTFYWVIATVFLLLSFFIYRLVYSQFGMTVRAVRDNEKRAISLGISPFKVKLMLFTVSAAISGIAGSMKALVFQIASLADLHIATSGEVVLMTLIGGVGTIAGPAIGALIVVIMQNYLAFLGQWVVFFQGAIFVVAVLAFRQGIVGVFAKLLGRPL